MTELAKWNPAAPCEGFDYSIAKLCDAIDFFRPQVIQRIREIGEEPRFHSKQWEYAQILEAHARYAKDAKHLVGLGCGCERSIPNLAEHAETITVTDLYALPGAWHNAARRPDEVWPHLKNLRVHPMDMRKIDLPRASADFIWSICAVEHVGFADDVIATVRRAGEVLKPGGVFVLTTEFTFADKPFYAPARPSGTMFFDKSMLRRLFTDTGLHLVEPIDLRLSSHPMNVPVWDHLSNGYPNVPTCLYRTQSMPLWGTYGGCVAVLLSHEDHGNDRFIEDPDQAARLKPLFELGRKMSRRLTAPTRWW